jgi:hypothetical protein
MESTMNTDPGSGESTCCDEQCPKCSLRGQSEGWCFKYKEKPRFICMSRLNLLYPLNASDHRADAQGESK